MGLCSSWQNSLFQLLPSPSLPAVHVQEPTLLCPSMKFGCFSQKTQTAVPALTLVAAGRAPPGGKREQYWVPAYGAAPVLLSGHPSALLCGCSPLQTLLYHLRTAELPASCIDWLTANYLFGEISGDASIGVFIFNQQNHRKCWASQVQQYCWSLR